MISVKTYGEANCDSCGKVFTRPRWTSKYCAACSTCSVDGCEKPRGFGSFCRAHAWRLNNQGSVGDAVVRAPRGDQKNRKKRQPALHFKCEQCSKEFYCSPSIAAGKTGEIRRKYCSRACRVAAVGKTVAFNCGHCGKEMIRKRKPGRGGIDYSQKHCSVACARAATREALYRGAKTLHHTGYFYIRTPDGRRMLEHRYVMEGAIGRPPHPHETVHHKNGIRTDNRIENLVLFSGKHGKGQDIRDLADWAIQFLREHPSLAVERGIRVISLESQESTEVLEDLFEQSLVSEGIRSVGRQV